MSSDRQLTFLKHILKPKYLITSLHQLKNKHGKKTDKENEITSLYLFEIYKQHFIYVSTKHCLPHHISIKKSGMLWSNTSHITNQKVPSSEYSESMASITGWQRELSVHFFSKIIYTCSYIRVSNRYILNPRLLLHIQAIFF